MKSTWVLGTAGGLAIAALSIASNLRRADPYLVSFAPDLFGAAIIGLLIVLVVRRASRGADAGRARTIALQTTVIAAVACAVPMSIFAWAYFPSHPLELAAAAGGMSFVLVNVVGLSTAFLASRSITRVRPSADLPSTK